MRQTSFADLDYDHKKRQTRRELFLAEMEKAVPWALLLEQLAPHSPTSGRRGRQPMPLLAMLRIHCMQQWFSFSDRQMEDALYEIEGVRRFAGFAGVTDALPDETIYALWVPSLIFGISSKTTAKGNPWYFGMKIHIGADANSGAERATWGYAGASTDYPLEAQAKQEPVVQTEKAQPQTIGGAGKGRTHNRIIKCQFGFRKTRYRGLAKNASQVNLLGRPGQSVPSGGH